MQLSEIAEYTDFKVCFSNCCKMPLNYCKLCCAVCLSSSAFFVSQITLSMINKQRYCVHFRTACAKLNYIIGTRDSMWQLKHFYISTLHLTFVTYKL